MFNFPRRTFPVFVCDRCAGEMHEVVNRRRAMITGRRPGANEMSATHPRPLICRPAVAAASAAIYRPPRAAVGTPG
jgi:hypothetical protein